MGKARYDIAPQFIKAEIRRQRYLDFFNEYPGKIAADLERHMLEVYGETGKTTNTTRQLMALGEIRAVKADRRGWKYFANVLTTTPADVFSKKQREAAKRRMDELHGNEVERHKESKPGHYIHRAGHYENVPDHKPGSPLSCQGGQGGMRERVYAGIVGALT